MESGWGHQEQHEDESYFELNFSPNETRNRSTRVCLAVLKSTVDEMNAAHDPLLHYQVLMRRSSKRTEGSGGQPAGGDS